MKHAGTETIETARLTLRRLELYCLLNNSFLRILIWKLSNNRKKWPEASRKASVRPSDYDREREEAMDAKYGNID